MKALFESLYSRWPSLPFVLFGVFYAWLDLTVFSPLVFAEDAAWVESIRTEYLWVFFALSVSFNLVCVIGPAHIAPLLEKKQAPFATAGCLACCTLLSFAAASGFVDAQVILAAAFFGALGQTYLTLLMVKRFLALSGYQIFVNIALMRVVAGMIYFIVAGMPQIVGLLVLVALPIVLAIAMYYSFSLHPVSQKCLSTNESPEGESSAGFRFGRILVAGFALILVVNSVGFGNSMFWPYVEIMCIVLSLALIAVLVYVGSRKDTVISYWSYVATISVVLAFLIAALLPGLQFFGYVVCGSFRAILDSFYLGFLIVIAHRQSVSSIRLTGAFYAVYLFSVICGMCMTSVVRSLVSTSTYSVGAAIISILTCAFLLIAFTPHYTQELLGISFDQGQRPGSTANHDTVSSFTTNTSIDVSATNRIADAFGLSAREKEVFQLLLAGCTIRMISNELSISANTTKTHMRNIYMKAGVKSREELLILTRKK